MESVVLSQATLNPGELCDLGRTFALLHSCPLFLVLLLRCRELPISLTKLHLLPRKFGF